MKIQGEHRFAAPREEVWKALLDPEVLARTVPGSQGLTQTGENEFEGELKIKVGPVQGVFKGKVALQDLDPPRGYTLKLDGRGAPGFVDGSGAIALEDADGATLLRYDVDAQVGGRIAGVGQRLLDSSAKVITRQALEALEVQIQARFPAGGGAAPGPGDEQGGGGSSATDGSGSAAAAPGETASRGAAPAAPPPAPSTARFAAAVVKGVVADLVPPERRRAATIVGVAVAALLVLIGLRSCA